MPLTLGLWWLHGRWSCRASHSMIKETDKAESSKALAWWVKLSGPITFTLHFGSSISSLLPEFDVCIVTSLCSSLAGEDDLNLFDFSLRIWSMWIHKWCGPWYTLRLWPQGHCLTKCSGFKQFRHSHTPWQLPTSCCTGMPGRTCRHKVDACYLACNTATIYLGRYIRVPIGVLVRGHCQPFLPYKSGVFCVTSLKIHEF